MEVIRENMQAIEKRLPFSYLNFFQRTRKRKLDSVSTFWGTDHGGVAEID